VASCRLHAGTAKQPVEAQPQKPVDASKPVEARGSSVKNAPAAAAGPQIARYPPSSSHRNAAICCACTGSQVRNALDYPHAPAGPGVPP
jgi:hypothetical protein